MEISKYITQTGYQNSLDKTNLDKTNLERAEKGKTGPATEESAQSKGDRVSLSDDARLRTQAFSTAMAAPDVRQERVDALKKQVADGSYVIDSKKIAEKMLAEDAEMFG